MPVLLIMALSAGLGAVIALVFLLMKSPAGAGTKALLTGALASIITVAAMVAVHSQRNAFTGTYNWKGGKIVLFQKGSRVVGTYEDSVPGKIEGTVSGHRLNFSWVDQKNRRGRGYWDLTYDMKKTTLEGRWGNGESDSDGGAWLATKAADDGWRDSGDRERRREDEGKSPLSKPVMPHGTHKCVQCPSPDKSGVLPQDRWLVIIGNSDGPIQCMFLNSRTGVLHDAEYPAIFKKDGYYPCFQRCYTFESQNVLKVFDPNTGQANRYPIKILNFGMNTYVFGPRNGESSSWSALDYPGWGPNGEIDLSSKCDCR